MSGISGMDEALILHHDPTPFGAFLSFPFVPGNENLGIVTEVGEEVHGIEPGERVIVDPVLSCRPRQVQPPCPSCSRGRTVFVQKLRQRGCRSGNNDWSMQRHFRGLG